MVLVLIFNFAFFALRFSYCYQVCPHRIKWLTQRGSRSCSTPYLILIASSIYARKRPKLNITPSILSPQVRDNTLSCQYLFLMFVDVFSHLGFIPSEYRNVKLLPINVFVVKKWRPCLLGELKISSHLGILALKSRFIEFSLSHLVKQLSGKMARVVLSNIIQHYTKLCLN